MDDDFTLFETMLYRSGRGIRAIRWHMRRLSSSAAALGFSYDEQACRLRLESETAMLPSAGLWRVRLDLSRFGGIQVRCAPLEPLDHHRPAFVLEARSVPNPGEAALALYKTSRRSTYDDELRWAQSLGAFDAIFFNQSGELTEGARTNVFIRVAGVWKTPPLTCSVLPGTLRARVLSHCAAVQEVAIDREEFRKAERIVLSNALRGLIPVVLHP
ncbi:aminotransferase class IV [Rubrivivax sp. RP6-9]|uniref:aminotransferase class IV n=1 Tax=Rubrivivax sp. RP6-9 TaxID=3415750 RepID=UPI003CC5F5CB